MQQARKIQVRVQRSNPALKGEPFYETYQVPLEDGMSVANVLSLINELFAAALAYRVSCRRGLCASCLMKVNGRTRLACCEAVTGDLTLEPAFPDRVAKDLVSARERQRVASRGEGVKSDESTLDLAE